jgi:protein-S-isoprenylcysteine O-methyltransferase Ste14
MSTNTLALVISFSLYFWVGAIFEERKLERYFGDDYKNYKARTPMFVPLPKR